MKVLALTYTLEAQHVGTNHLSETPTVRPTVEISKPKKLLSTEVDADGKKIDAPAGQHIVGFVNPRHDEEDENESSEDDEEDRVEDQVTNL